PETHHSQNSAKSLKSCRKRLFASIDRPVSGKSLPIYARQSSHPLAIKLNENGVLVWNPTAALRAIDSLLIAAKGYRLRCFRFALVHRVQPHRIGVVSCFYK